MHAVGPPAEPSSEPPAGAPAPAPLGLLLRVAHRRAARAATEALRPLGIEGRHMGVLLTLSRRGGAESQSGLIDALGSDKSAMVRTIDDLEQLGAAVRRTDPQDRRARVVELTDEGRELLARAAPLARAAADDVFGSLTEDEQRMLERLLSRIAE
jgi:MarR family transcriptional regulator, lower aerobic nicotinate degradation pathway regulator